MRPITIKNHGNPLSCFGGTAGVLTGSNPICGDDSNAFFGEGPNAAGRGFCGGATGFDRTDVLMRGDVDGEFLCGEIGLPSFKSHSQTLRHASASPRARCAAPDHSCPT